MWVVLCKRIGWVHGVSVSYNYDSSVYSQVFLHWCRKDKSWSRHQNCKRIGWVHTLVMSIKPRYEDIGYCSVKSMSLLKPGATGCHGTRIARGVPLPVYINLDLYSGFWCTSRCVVFKYSVPPLTDQALRKVLLTS